MKNDSKTMITVETSFLNLPRKAHDTDAAFDLYTTKPVEVRSNTRLFVPLGFKIALPKNIALLIQPRSGQTGKGMIAFAQAPDWMGGDIYQIRINADSMLGLVDCGYGGIVNAIVKCGRFRLKHRIMQLLGFKIFIAEGERIAQGRFVNVPNVELIRGKVNNNRGGLGSTDK